MSRDRNLGAAHRIIQVLHMKPSLIATKVQNCKANLFPYHGALGHCFSRIVGARKVLLITAILYIFFFENEQARTKLKRKKQKKAKC